MAASGPTGCREPAPNTLTRPDPHRGLLALSQQAVRQIEQECRLLTETKAAESGSRGEAQHSPAVVSPLSGCDAALLQLLRRQAALVSRLISRDTPPPSSSSPAIDAAAGRDGSARSEPAAAASDVDVELASQRLTDLLSMAHVRFYAYVFSALPACWRQLYADASIVLFALRFWRAVRGPEEKRDNWKVEGVADGAGAGSEVGKGTADGAEANFSRFGDAAVDELVATLDMALILAGGGEGPDRGRRWFDAAMDLLWDAWTAGGDRSTASSSKRPDDFQPDNGSTGSPPRKRSRLETSTSTTLRHPTEPRIPASFPTSRPFVPPVRHPIARHARGVPTLDAFQAYLGSFPRQSHPAGPEPLVLGGLLRDWPAFGRRRAEDGSDDDEDRDDGDEARAADGSGSHAWRSPAYLLTSRATFAGKRLVPVEVGRSYVDDGWGQRIVRLGDFVRRALLGQRDGDENDRGKGSEGTDRRPQTMYLAQHPLLTQLPGLRADVLVPDLCYTSPPKPGLGDDDTSSSSADADADADATVLANAWFGPARTITPLHTDPHHNLLCQVVGAKYVRLYAPVLAGRPRASTGAAGETTVPSMAEALRARGVEDGVDMGNTSGVDVGVVEGWDEDGDGGGGGAGGQQDAADKDCGWEERFRQVPFVDCILEEGDTLYIPQGWWHYVRSLSVSFSVSFWWS